MFARATEEKKPVKHSLRKEFAQKPRRQSETGERESVYVRVRVCERARECECAVCVSVRARVRAFQRESACVKNTEKERARDSIC